MVPADDKPAWLVGSVGNEGKALYITEFPRWIGIVTSRLASGCEHHNQVAFICALAEFVDHDLQTPHALEAVMSASPQVVI